MPAQTLDLCRVSIEVTTLKPLSLPSFSASSASEKASNQHGLGKNLTASVARWYSKPFAVSVRRDLYLSSANDILF